MEDASFSLVVVSNRLPFVLTERADGNGYSRKSSAGGLVTAVAPVVIKSQGRWVGWTGLPESAGHVEVPEAAEDDDTPAAGLTSSRIAPVHLRDADFEGYYNGICNGTLWPIFHSMPGHATFDHKAWTSYVAVNEIFAEKTLQALEDTLAESPDKAPIVWIHDYHLLLAGHMIRELALGKGLKCIVAFFLHIPFPAFDILKILPWEHHILEGVLGCDVIGFHHEDYCFNFMNCCDRGMGFRCDRSNMIVERNDGRFVFIKAMPISIPFKRFKNLARRAKPLKMASELKVILGVDRLDYTKGLPNRLKAYKLFLNLHPQFREKVVLVQIAVPSRTDVAEYHELKETMDKLVGSINGEFSTTSWTPIIYIFSCIPQASLASLYRHAHVALITPLRDGMNLVAKEFVASRDVEKNPGVLILSPFAGAGRNMEEALLVNPYELENVALSLERAVTMGDEEAATRMRGLQAREETHDVFFWMKDFIGVVNSFLTKKDKLSCENHLEFEEKFGSFVESKTSVALLLDFDGTLTPLASHPSLVTIPSTTKDLLQKLSQRENVEMAVISGRPAEEVREKVGIENVTYSGSHGNVILYKNGDVFDKGFSAKEMRKLVDKVTPIVNRYQGAWIEKKGHTLCVHVKHVRSDLKSQALGQVKQAANEVNYNTFWGHDALECKPQDSEDKGTAVMRILERLYGSDWQERVGAIYIGDDTTDEDAMRALKGQGKSIKVCVNDAPTNADVTIKSTHSVVHFLHWLLGKLSNKMDITPVIDKRSNQRAHLTTTRS